MGGRKFPSGLSLHYSSFEGRKSRVGKSPVKEKRGKLTALTESWNDAKGGRGGGGIEGVPKGEKNKRRQRKGRCFPETKREEVEVLNRGKEGKEKKKERNHYRADLSSWWAKCFQCQEGGKEEKQNNQKHRARRL